MKTLVFVLALIPFAFVQGEIASLPSCALTCLATAVSESPCTLTNQTCICTNAQVQSRMQACVLQTCTIKQSLTTKNITMLACGAPIRSKVVLGRTFNLVLGCISALFVAIRVGYKLALSRTELGWDDYAIALVFVCVIFNTVFMEYGIFSNGIGRDIWTLPFDEITRFGRFFYISQINYFVDIVLLKFSLLFFYQRIFPDTDVQRALWVTIAFNCAYGVTFLIAGIFQCNPVSFYWTRWDGEHKGKCMNINALGWANAAISIALDIWMLAIPLSQIVHLHLAWKKKVGVGMMFFVGTFVTVVSIVRLQFLVTYATSPNATWDQWDICNWSVIELNVGVICACMPTLRVILVRLFPKVFSIAANQSCPAKHGNDRSSDLGFGSRLKNGDKKVSGNLSVIKYTNTFPVQHEERGGLDGDEDALVQMNDLGMRGKIASSHSSEISL